MEDHTVPSGNESAVPEAVKEIMQGFAAFIGTGAELILYSLSDRDRSVLYTVNNWHSGVSIGDPMPEILRIKIDDLIAESINGETPYSRRTFYFTTRTGPDKEKVVLVPIRSRDNIIAVLMVGYYLNTPIQSFLTAMSPDVNAGCTREAADITEEYITKAVVEARERVDQDTTVPRSGYIRAIVELLDKDGVFRMKSAVRIVAKALHISPNTIYLHLRVLRGRSTAGCLKENAADE